MSRNDPPHVYLCIVHTLICSYGHLKGKLACSVHKAAALISALSKFTRLAPAMNIIVKPRERYLLSDLNFTTQSASILGSPPVR